MPDQKQTSNQSTAVVATAEARPVTPKRTVKTLLESEEFRMQLKAALPKHITPDRMVRVVLTAGMKTPKLFECTQESLFLAVLNCAAVGLEPDGRRAHLIPFKNTRKGVTECQLIYGYAGLCELVYRSGLVSSIHADLVCENDIFEVNAGELEKHVVDYKKPRGDPYAAYCVVRFKDGTHMVEVMAKDEIEKIRDNSQGWRAYKKGLTSSSPWADAPGEMWRKTVCRRVVKWCPQSSELSKALEDDASDAIDIEAIIKAGVESRKGLSAAVDGDPEKKEPEAPTSDPAGPQGPQGQPGEPGEPAPKEYSQEERSGVIGALEDFLLNTGTGARDLLKKAVAEKVVPEGSLDFDLLELPTADLFAIADKYISKPEPAKA